VIEQHDAFMKQLRGGREAPRPRPARAAEEPEGVALYQCRQVILPSDADHQPHLCGKGIEARPYDPVPYHCTRPMRLVGYDWERDLAS
jgi:hypothetical protein